MNHNLLTKYVSQEPFLKIKTGKECNSNYKSKDSGAIKLFDLLGHLTLFE